LTVPEKQMIVPEMEIILQKTDQTLSRLVLLWIGVAVVSVVAVAVAPLTAFVLMISAFGLPHVIYEMRYVDERFSSRSSRALLGVLAALVGLIAAGRIANGMQLIPYPVFVPLELGLGATLALLAAWHMKRLRWLGALVGFVFVLGATFEPVMTFVVWAWLHNLTPLGFVAEITSGRERVRWLCALSLPFVVLPALVATGVFHDAAIALLGTSSFMSMSIFGAGDRPLLSFLPPGSSNVYLFSAAVVAQAMHYVGVIVLMPYLLREKQPHRTPESVVRWPGWGVFAIAVSFVSLIAFGLYAVSYTDAKSGYAVASAVHAWIELPVLLMALGQGFTTARK
jgi:hypothetical protein